MVITFRIAFANTASLGGRKMAGLVLREDRDGLATLTLNRPEKLNSLNVGMFIELRAHVEQIAREPERIGLVVVRGAGKCFSAGHDLADIAKGERPPKPNFQSETIERLPECGPARVLARARVLSPGAPRGARV